MASKLDDMLEPGERVVYRVRRSRSAVQMVLITVFVIVLFWSLFIATSAPRVTWPFGVALGTMLAAILSIWLQPDPIVVTDRRLLYDGGAWAILWSGQRRTAIPLAEIAEIRGIEPGWHRSLNLRLADGRVVGIRNITNPKRLAGALATARGDTW